MECGFCEARLRTPREGSHSQNARVPVLRKTCTQRIPILPALRQLCGRCTRPEMSMQAVHPLQINEEVSRNGMEQDARTAGAIC